MIAIGLGGNTYSINEPDSGYIHVLGVPASVYGYQSPNSENSFYGGNQSWFSNISFSSNDINLFIEDSGCGLIASSDVSLYFDNGACLVDWDYYYNYVLDVNSDFAGLDLYGLALHNSYMISPIFIQQYFFNEYLRTSTLYSVNDSNKIQILELIINSLINDVPVILFENDPIASINDDIDDVDLTERNGFPMYILDNNYQFRTSNNRMKYHYVTITGILFDENSNRIMLRVQSWGREYYLDYNEFCDYNNQSPECAGTVIIFN